METWAGGGVERLVERRRARRKSKACACLAWDLAFWRAEDPARSLLRLWRDWDAGHRCVWRLHLEIRQQVRDHTLVVSGLASPPKFFFFFFFYMALADRTVRARLGQSRSRNLETLNAPPSPCGLLR